MRQAELTVGASPATNGHEERPVLSAAGLYSQLGATVPTRGFHLAYSPGFRDGILARSG